MGDDKNEFGETISDKDFDDLVKRIRKLSDKQIDELWYLCGYIYSEDSYPYREKNFKAITQEYLDKIRMDFESAKIVVGWLWDETKTEEIMRNLEKVEREN
jgi:hypothetical protein